MVKHMSFSSLEEIDVRLYDFKFCSRIILMK